MHLLKHELTMTVLMIRGMANTGVDVRFAHAIFF